MKVVLAVDQARDAHVAALLLQTVRLPRASEVWVAHILSIPPILRRTRSQLAGWRQKEAATARRLIKRIQQPLQAQGLRVHPLVKEGVPGPELLDTVERTHADLAVVGPHGRSRIVRFLLGGVSELFLNEAPCSVLIARGRPRVDQDRGLRVLLAMDFSKDAKASARFLSKLRMPRASRATLLHVEEQGDHAITRISGLGRIDLSHAFEEAVRKSRRQTQLMLERIGSQFTQQGLAVEYMFATGVPPEEILRAAERHRADLIVMGSKGLTGLDRYLLGSVSRKVARHSSCSVLVVRKKGR